MVQAPTKVSGPRPRPACLGERQAWTEWAPVPRATMGRPRPCRWSSQNAPPGPPAHLAHRIRVPTRLLLLEGQGPEA